MNTGAVVIKRHVLHNFYESLICSVDILVIQATKLRNKDQTALISGFYVNQREYERSGNTMHKGSGSSLYLKHELIHSSPHMQVVIRATHKIHRFLLQDGAIFSYLMSSVSWLALLASMPVNTLQQKPFLQNNIHWANPNQDQEPNTCAKFSTTLSEW